MTQTELEKLIDVYVKAREKMMDIIINYHGIGTKVYYNTVLQNVNKIIAELAAKSNEYINTAIPAEYQKSLDEVYDYFQQNNLEMLPPHSFAQIHADAVYALTREMQYNIGQGLEQAGRQVLRYLDDSRDNTLRKIGLESSAEKKAMGSTVNDMRKSMIDKLNTGGFMTVQYGSGTKAYQVSLDTYASMVARSTTREAGNLARINQLSTNGYDLVIMTSHYPTCRVCAKLQGRVFSLSGKDKRFPSLYATAFKGGYNNVHPNCRHSVHPFVESMQSPEELQHHLQKGSEPLADNRSEDEINLYNKQQTDNRQIRQDRYQWERYKQRLGEDAPKSFHAFRRIKKAGGEAWEDLHGKYKDISKTVVNWDYVNSESWKNKFNDITSNEKVNNRLRTLSEQILKHRQGSFYEDMYVVDTKTGDLKGFNTQSKTPFQVDANDSITKAFADSAPDSLIGIHNHPLSSIPSLGDLNAIASRSSMAQWVIICHDGTVFTYTKPKITITKQNYDTYLTKHKRYSKITREDKGFANLCEDFQFEYRRIE